MRRFLVILLSLVLLFSIMIVPASAYTVDGDTYIFDWDDIVDMASAGYITLASDFVFTVYDSDGATIYSYTVPSGYSLVVSGGYLYLYLGDSSFSFASASSYDFSSLDLYFDFSSYGSFYNLEFDGNLYIGGSYLFNLTNLFLLSSVLIIGSSSYTLPSDYDILYSVSSSVFTGFSLSGSVYLGNIRDDITYRPFVRLSSAYDFTIRLDTSPLSDVVDIIDSSNDSASSIIDSMDSIESQFIDSAQEAFDELDWDLELSSDMANAVSTVSSSVSTVWASLGDFQYIFIISLMLAIILVLAGRLSKSGSSGGDSL